MSKTQTETQIQTFTNTEFGNLQTIQMNNEVWFIGINVANMLGYNKPKDAVRRIDKEDRRIITKSQSPFEMDFEIPNRGLTIINESGLYSLILSSKLPTAKKFKRWVTSEVLPSIRKTGAYMTPETLQDCLSNPDTMIEILQTLKNEQEKRKQLEVENQCLNDKNNNLTLTNKALTQEVTSWDDRAIINSLIRTYAHRVLNNDNQYAWNIFYKELLYKEGINLNARWSDRRKSKLSYVRNKEWDRVLSVAVAMCENKRIDTSEILAKKTKHV